MFIAKSTKKLCRSVSIFLVISMMGLMGPHGYASAAIIGTEAVAQSGQASQARRYVRSVLERAEVQDVLMKQGIDAAEAKKRVDSLTDAEAIRLASEIEKLPAGGSTLGVMVIVGSIVFLVLLFTDIAGYTDIFPFVKK